MCEQLYLMSFWICQLHGRRQRNIRCQHPLLISWIIIHISRNIHIYFLIFHLNIYSSLPHHPLKTFPPPLPLQRCTWRSPLLNQRRQGWAFSVMQRNIPLLNVCQLLQRIPGLSATQCRVAAVKSDSSTAIRLWSSQSLASAGTPHANWKLKMIKFRPNLSEKWAQNCDWENDFDIGELLTNSSRR